MRPWLRLLIGTAAVFPALLLLGDQQRAGPRVAGAIWAVAALGAILIGVRRGPVEATGGDCSVYPRCYTTGHPYAFVAGAMIFTATAITFWLWDKRGPKREHEPHDYLARQ
jgi:hypothetical protein